MSPEPSKFESEPSSLPVTQPSYEQCVAQAMSPKADYVISPLAMAKLFAWDDND